MDRIGLKFDLIYRRGHCAICGKRITTSVDMHEAILTRGDALGIDIDIMVRENCCLVHPGACHQKAQTFEGRVLCIQNLLLYEGLNVLRWLEGIRLMSKSGIVDERIHLVMEVMDVHQGKG